MTPKPHPYGVVIIRFWQEKTPEMHLDTRFTLEIAATGERFGFSSYAKLLAALQIEFSRFEYGQQQNSNAAPLN